MSDSFKICPYCEAKLLTVPYRKRTVDSERLVVFYCGNCKKDLGANKDESND